MGIKVIGCTTTGLSKYRGLLSALQPRTLLIEEAAETLEGTVIAGMFDSLERLILVGDHKQLQAHCNVRALEVEPYFLNMSMFERLVNNGIPYTMLNEQRRMITDIRKLLCIEPQPFYKGLRDHPSVLDRKTNRAPVPGMGGRDVWFFHHNWPEARNQDFSMINHDEAEMITGFFSYLVLNGTPIEKITILSFYNGQKKRILSELKSHPVLKSRGRRFNVHTVDSFQGEENDIILLSLVRSNTYLSVGFLESQNRLVVALSRARRGLYLFGNVVTLVGAESSDDGIMGIGRDPLWGPLSSYMVNNSQLNIDGGLPVTCQKHGTTVIMNEGADFHNITAGCKRKCEGKLPCGHGCPYFCHPFDHEEIICKVSCPRPVPGCGHGCSRSCGEVCNCAVCVVPEPMLQHSRTGFDQSHSSSNNSLYDASPKQSQRFTNKNIRGNGKSPSTPKRQSTLPGIQSFGQRNTRQQASPGTPESWKKWDAQKADRALAEDRIPVPKIDQNKLLFNETFRKTTVTNGVRMKAGAAVYNVIGGSNILGEEIQTLIHEPMPKPKLAPSATEAVRPRISYPQATLTPIEPSSQSSLLVPRGTFKPQVKLTPLPGIIYPAAERSTTQGASAALSGGSFMDDLLGLDLSNGNGQNFAERSANVDASVAVVEDDQLLIQF